MKTHTITLTVTAPNRLTGDDVSSIVQRLFWIGKQDAADTLDNGDGQLKEARDAMSLCVKWATRLIEPLLCISNEHIKQSTCDAFSEADYQPGWPIYYANEYGAFVCINEGYTGADGPRDLAEVVKWARAQGIAWLKFDPDGSVIDDLHIHTWADQ